MAAPHYQSPLPELRRVSRREPCPKCGKLKHCEIRADGAIHCMNEESPIPCNGRGGGWWHRLPAWGAPSQPIHVVPPTPKPEPQRADPATIDAVDSAIIDLCPVSQAHLDYLATCGIPAEQASGSYGTLPAPRQQGIFLHAPLERFPDEVLLTIPGISRKDGVLQVAGAGMLVASRDTDHRITSLQVRRDEGGYYGLSGGDRPSAGARAHVIDHGTPRAWLVEGAKNGHSLSIQTKETTVCLPGHANHTDALAALKALQERGLYCVVIALDQDQKEKTAAAVEASRQSLIDACLGLGFAVQAAKWDGALAKGIDELRLRGYEPIIENIPSRRLGTAGAADDDCGTREDGRRLTQSEEAARYRVIRGVLLNYDQRADEEKKESPLAPLPAIDKIAYLLTCEATDSYPNSQATPGIQGRVKDTSIGVMAGRAGCSPATMAKAVNHCVAVKLLTREDKTESGTGHRIVALGVVRKPGFHELFPKSEERKKDAARKRCKECGSEDVQTTIVKRHTCLKCGTVEYEGQGHPMNEDTTPIAVPYAHVVNTAAAVFESGKAQLYRQDGEPVYSPLEQQTRITDLLAAYDASVGTAIGLKESHAARAARAAQAEQRDPVERLDLIEQGKASRLQPFFRENFAELPLSDLVERCRTVMAHGGQAEMVLALQYGARRVTAERAAHPSMVATGEGVTLNTAPHPDATALHALGVALDELQEKLTPPEVAKTAAAAEYARRELAALKALARGRRAQLDGSAARAERDMIAQYRARL